MPAIFAFHNLSTFMDDCSPASCDSRWDTYTFKVLWHKSITTVSITARATIT